MPARASFLGRSLKGSPGSLSLLPPHIGETPSPSRVARAEAGGSWLSGVDVVMAGVAWQRHININITTPESSSTWHQQKIWNSGEGRKILRIELKFI